MCLPKHFFSATKGQTALSACVCARRVKLKRGDRARAEPFRTSPTVYMAQSGGGGGVKYAQKHARARITSAAIICAQSARESVRMRLELVIHAWSGGHNDASAHYHSRAHFAALK